MITFACVWVQANVPYDVGYVQKLKSGIERHYAENFRFVVLTDRPTLMKSSLLDAEVRHVRPVKDLAGWLSKIELFNPANELTGRVVYMDLDSLPVANLTSIVEYPSAFAMVPDAGTFQGRGQRKVVKRYNTSVMVFDAGPKLHRLHALWKPSVADRLWGDQDYVGQMLPSEDVMPLMWFPRVSEVSVPDDASETDALAYFAERETKVLLVKKPKNREVAERARWMRELW